MNSASLCSLAGWYDNPIPPRFLAPIDCLKIPAQVTFFFGGGGDTWRNRNFNKLSWYEALCGNWQPKVGTQIFF
jgi:hypothetical protein